MKQLLLLIAAIFAFSNQVFAQMETLSSEEFNKIRAEEMKALSDTRPLATLPKKTLNYKLSFAVYRQDDKQIRDLMYVHADINFIHPFYGTSIVERVVKTGLPKLTALILEYKPVLSSGILNFVPYDVCAKPVSGFAKLFASDIPNCDVVNALLISAGAEITPKNYNRIWKVFRQSNPDILLSILPRLKINYVDEYSYSSTPFLIMLRNDHIDTLLEPLLKAGAQFDIKVKGKNICGLREFWIASLNMKEDEKLRRLKLFIDTKRADINCTSEFGSTLLFDLIRDQSVQGVQIAVDAGADVYKKDTYGMTAMTYARKILNKNRDDRYEQIRKILTDAQRKQRR